MDASESWFYAVGDTQMGPVDLAGLRDLIASGSINAHSLVWREGMAQWMPAAGVPQFQAVAAAAAVQFGSAAMPLEYERIIGQRLPYAGFWLRFAAAVLDTFVVGIPHWIVFAAIRAACGLPIFETGAGGLAALIEVAESLSSIVVSWLYEALMTSSRHQATVGKLACGIKVTDIYGRPISFGRATGRHFAKIISAIILFIGYIMAGFTEKKQALHDMIAGTLVIRR